MNQETSNVESAPAVAVKRVVRARHPWQQAWDAKAKLKAARAVAARRRELKWHKEHDDLSKLLTNAQTRKQYRKKKGLQLDAPPAKPWDFAKGKCPNASNSATGDRDASPAKADGQA